MTNITIPGHLCDYAVKEASYCYFTPVTNKGNVLECTSALKTASALQNATCCLNDYKVAPNCIDKDINNAIPCDYDSGDGTVYYKAIAGTTQFYAGVRKADADIQLVCLSADRNRLVNDRRCAAYDDDYPCCADGGRMLWTCDEVELRLTSSVDVAKLRLRGTTAGTGRRAVCHALRSRARFEAERTPCQANPQTRGHRPAVWHLLRRRLLAQPGPRRLGRRGCM